MCTVKEMTNGWELCCNETRRLVMRGVGLRVGDCALTYDDVDGKCPVLDNGHHVAFEKMAGVIMQREILEDRYCHGCLYHRKKQVEAVKASA